jgi:hypothetical protein
MLKQQVRDGGLNWGILPFYSSCFKEEEEEEKRTSPTRQISGRTQCSAYSFEIERKEKKGVK